MKRIIIIFIIACCLLSFVEISYLANEIGSPGEFWNFLGDFEKLIYVRGIEGGIWMFMEQLLSYTQTPQYANNEDKSKFEAFMSDSFHFISLFQECGTEKRPNLFDTFLKIIDDLYEDPSNSYIPLFNMCLIASRKLRGEPIESLLQEARKKALPFENEKGD